MKKTLRYFLFSFFSLNGIAQISVTNTSNASDLVNKLLGNGVEVTNVTFNCKGVAAGVFKAENTNLGLSSGIILSTAEAIHAIGPNNSDGSSSSLNEGCFNSSESFFDSDLMQIEPLAKYDGCALEFDLKPACNVLNLSYVFASEEYPESVGEGFNDAFGFFIWGANPNGGTYSGTNLALVPGTNLPVSIDNINASVNSDYFIDNTNGKDIEYDGFTKPITSSIDVVTCSAYHLKFVIADAGDCYFSSAVFLSENGLTCPQAQSPLIIPEVKSATCNNNGSIRLTVENYQGIPTFYWLPGMQNTASLSDLAAGSYTCSISFTSPCPFTQTYTVEVDNKNAFQLNTIAVNSYCNKATGIAKVSGIGGVQPYGNAIWNTIPPQTGNEIDSLFAGVYRVKMTDASGCEISKSIEISNTTPEFTIKDSIVSSSCNHANGSIYIKMVNGGLPPYHYSWNTHPPVYTSYLKQVITGNYIVSITDSNECEFKQNFELANSDTLLYKEETLNETCSLQNGSITIRAFNGTPPYRFIWNDTLENDGKLQNLMSGVYTFKLIDSLGCKASGNFQITNLQDFFSGIPYHFPLYPKPGEELTLGIHSSSEWEIKNIQIANGIIKNNTDNITFKPMDLGKYEALFIVESKQGCRDSISYDFEVWDGMAVYIPNALVVKDQSANKIWKVYGEMIKQIHIEIYNRNGEKIFESIDLEQGWDGTYQGKLCSEGTYVYKVIAEDENGQQKTFSGYLILIR